MDKKLKIKGIGPRLRVVINGKPHVCKVSGPVVWGVALYMLVTMVAAIF